MGSRRIGWLAASLALVMGGGCAQIPRSGAIVEGGRVDVVPDSRGLESVAVGPVQDASPMQIATGLVAAMVSSDEEYRVARSFTTRNLAADWQPRQDTIVFTGQPGIALSPAAGGRVTGTITVTQVASVTPDGRYRRREPSRRVVKLDLVRDVDNQWRVASFPNLTLIDSDDFSFSYRPHPVYFLSQDGQSLIPVLRYLPNGAGLATRLVAAVLAGPPAGLRAGYGNAVPEGTELAPPATVITNGTTAVVALTDQAKTASRDQRIRLRAQLLATLRGVLPITEVQLTVDGGALDVPQDAPPRTLDPSPGLPVLLRGDKVVMFNGRDVDVAKLPDLSRINPTSVAESAGALRYAVVADAASRLYLVSPGVPLTRPVLTGADLTQPSFDPTGWVFTSSSPSPGLVDAVSATGAAHRVKAAWLSGRHVAALRVSPDGGLACVVSSAYPGGPGRLDVVAIRRSDDVPQELLRGTDSIRSLKSENVRDAAWRSTTEVTLATSSGTTFLQLDGPTTATAAVPGVREVASGGTNSVGDLALTRSQQVYLYSGGSWELVDGLRSIRSIAFPG